MNLYRVNLNLLKVFFVLMKEQHVSAAAGRLHLTQSAVSNSLQQLRELFQDELLIRGPKKMVPTQKALHLAPQVEHVLRTLETVLFYSDDFEYKTSTRTFNLGMTDYSEYVLLPKIYERIKKLAPYLSLKIQLYHKFTPEDFESEQLELGIGQEMKFPKQLMVERIFSDRTVCVARENNPIFKKPLTLKRYLQAEHLATCAYSDNLPKADQALKKLNLKRNIKISLPNALPAFQMLSTSDLVGTFSRSIVMQAEKRYHLKYELPPFEIAEFHIAQICHRQQNNDSGLLWLRNIIKNICAESF